MAGSTMLSGKRVAMLVEEGFEDRELTGPLDALRAAGATVTIVGPAAGTEFHGKRGQAVVASDAAAGAVRINDFDALVIPGGHAPDKMRMRHAMVDLARDAMEAGKPVAAICHGPQLLISADVLRGRGRCEKRRWPLRRQAGRRGWQPHHIAQAGRRPDVQRGDHSRAVEGARVDLFATACLPLPRRAGT